MLRAVDFTLNHLRPARPAALGLLGLERHARTSTTARARPRASGRRCSSAGRCWTWPSCAGQIDRPADGAALRRPPRRRWRTAVNEHAWDGAWYARAFDDDGLPIGVSGAAHHAIDLIPQSWSRARARWPRRSGRSWPWPRPTRSSNTQFGTGPDVAALRRRRRARRAAPPPTCPGPRRTAASSATPTPGPSSRRRCSATATTAYRYYRQILPLARTDSDRLHGGAVHLLARTSAGPTHPSLRPGPQRLADRHGVVDLRRRHAVDPRHPAHATRACEWPRRIPPDWPGFKAHREFRGTAYEIAVRREGRGNAVSLVVDGKRRCPATSCRCRRPGRPR